MRGVKVFSLNNDTVSMVDSTVEDKVACSIDCIDDTLLFLMMKLLIDNSIIIIRHNRVRIITG